jgi:hypothetical protein
MGDGWGWANPRKLRVDGYGSENCYMIRWGTLHAMPPLWGIAPFLQFSFLPMVWRALLSHVHFTSSVRTSSREVSLVNVCFCSNVYPAGVLMHNCMRPTWLSHGRSDAQSEWAWIQVAHPRPITLSLCFPNCLPSRCPLPEVKSNTSLCKIKCYNAHFFPYMRKSFKDVQHSVWVWLSDLWNDI